MFKNPFSFKGRIRRLEYGISVIIYYVGICLISLAVPSQRGVSGDGSLIFLFAMIPLIWFFVAQGAKRCHDKGNNGWYQLIPFYILILIFSDGYPGVNEYGLNPKGIGNTDEIDELGKDIVD